jgi:hypothetical protein
MMFLPTKDWGGTRVDLTMPAGTQIDGTNPQWRGTPLPSKMPMSACGMDEEAATALIEWYPEHWHWLAFGPGIDREAIMARKAALDLVEERMRKPARALASKHG